MGEVLFKKEDTIVSKIYAPNISPAKYQTTTDWKFKATLKK